METIDDADSGEDKKFGTNYFIGNGKMMYKLI